ncbi:SEC-C metal-binding domain-containing protein [Aeromonas caviae]|uniref:SEC-C metal-binding domain-containing protein n=1 Tax=Aeromonas caviae TaxID=648 RepID=UPI0029D54A48|nr:SEC-C metal-binding domain-containing protein [Aeromonas caviae]MDX7829437.1 SEC-C metal-binding domain-containing protein [Aeromonas caviae]
MDDIQLAYGASADIGRLYRDAKAFSIDTPVLALLSLRGLAAIFCDYLDRGLTELMLSDKISHLDQQGMLKPKVKQQLRLLQNSGNKAAHPESYDFIKLNLPALVAEALVVARNLIEHLYTARHQDVPEYDIAEIESGVLKEMCVRAMLDQDVDAMNQAGNFFKERADQHSKDAVLLHSDGYPLEAKEDIDHAMFWFKRGANKKHPNCLYEYGHYLTKHLFNDQEKGQAQIHEGELYISQAALAGHADALVYAAQRTISGIGIFVQDEAYAFELYGRAAKLGHPAALSGLGLMYLEGVGCEASPIKAAQLTLQAAQAGFPQAQYNLAVLFMNGTGVPKSETDFIHWLEEAAAQDYPCAVYQLACLIRDGRIPNRPASDAEAEFERAMEFDEFRARATLSAADMIYERTSQRPDLLRAAVYLQDCFALLSTDGDPTDLRGECLLACKNVVERLREQINVNGPDSSLNGSDIITLTLFDHHCIPVVDRQVRQMAVAEQMYNLGRISSDQYVAYLLREACLNPRPIRQMSRERQRMSVLRSASNIPQLGRNEPCHCGSGKKFKKCHGREA